MSISKSYNKQNGVTYVYEVLENYWDKEKKQPRSKRKLIGKIDPETGEIVPTASRGRPKSKKAETDYKQLYGKALKEITQKDERIRELESLLKEYLEEDVKSLGEMEATVKSRRIKAESLLRRIG